MKKKYITPDAKMYDISLEEKIAATCSEQYYYTKSYSKCNDQQMMTGFQCYAGFSGES